MARQSPRQAFNVLSVALLLAAGCIIQSPDEVVANPPPVLAVELSPPSASVEAGGAQQFAAAVLGSGAVPQGVTWSVRPGSPSGPAGAVDGQGLYRVTMPVNTDARDYVVARSEVNAAIFAEAPVDVPGLSLTIAPTNVDVLLGDSVRFTATLHGLAIKDVLWSCSNDTSGASGFGTIDANGLYVAAPTPPQPGAYPYVSVFVRPAAGANLGASALIHLHLRAPLLTSASGPVRAGDTLLLSGSGFLPGAGVQWDTEFEDTSGRFGAYPPSVVSDQQIYAFVPFGGPWSGRLKLAMWAGSFEIVYSNLFDAGLPP